MNEHGNITARDWKVTKLTGQNKWLVYSGDVFGADHKTICQTDSEASALLIAAAPEMLDMLERFVLCNQGSDKAEIVAKVRTTKAILAKVKGGLGHV